MGIDPMLRLSQSRVLPLHHNHHKLERISKFELELQPWQGRVLTVKHHIRKEWSGVRESNSQQQIGNL